MIALWATRNVITIGAAPTTAAADNRPHRCAKSAFAKLPSDRDALYYHYYNYDYDY